MAESNVTNASQVTPVPQYEEEEDRLQSFHEWTKQNCSKEKLALYGFYYIGPNDNVTCNFCKVEISNWKVGDNVLREHLRWSPNCPLLRRRPTANKPINDEELQRSLPPASVDTVGIYSSIEYRGNSYPEKEFYEPRSSFPCLMENHPDYHKITTRLKSFDKWPKSMKQQPTDLSGAGFFYLQKGDQVKCFSCGGGLKDWEENDDPWEQHALWYEKCSYLNKVKNGEYITFVKNKYSKEEEEQTTRKIHSNTPSCLRSEKSNISASKLCKICYDNEIDVALFPCMHIITCIKCVSFLEKCPVCRQIITQVKRIYFS